MQQTDPHQRCQVTKRVAEVPLAAILVLAFTPSFAAAQLHSDEFRDTAYDEAGSPWTSVPMLFANGDGFWTGANKPEPGFANQPGVVAIPGNFNDDLQTDIAFHRPGSSWASVPVLFSTGDGSWTGTNQLASYANQPGVVAIPGFFNNDMRTDIAFVRPGSSWDSVPVLFANGDGTWTATNKPEPGFANQPGVVAVAGYFNNDGRTDIAFYRPGSSWNTVPVLFANGDGSWTGANKAEPGFANQPGVVAVPGYFNNDWLMDIAFHRPGSSWASVPVLFSTGDGSWTGTNQLASYANQPGVVAVPGYFNTDGRTDIAFYRPGSSWSTLPVLFANGDGTWTAANKSEPGFAKQSGVVAVAGYFNTDARTDIAFYRPGSSWNTVPVLFANGDGSWTGANRAEPGFANQPGVVAIPGYFNNDGPADMAFHRPSVTLTLHLPLISR